MLLGESMYLVYLGSKCVYTASWFLAVGALNCGFSALFVTP